LNATPPSFTLELSRHIRAPREKVFDAFVDPEAMRVWKCPRGMSVCAVSSDAQVGGKYQVAMRARDGSQFVVGGEYREVRRPERLAFTWAWLGDNMPTMQTLVEVSFIERDGGTLIDMTHSGFPQPTMRDQHGHGWRSCFNRLNDMLDARGTAATVVLLGAAPSNHTWSVHMGLVEKGVAYTLQDCRPRSAEALAVHPFGRIPALRDGDIEVFESSAILRYIDESFEGPGGLTFQPNHIMGRVRCDQWVSAINSYLSDTMMRRYAMQYVFPKGAGGQPDRGVIEGALADMPAQLAALDKVYAHSDYLAGPSLSIADLMLAPILHYVGAMPEGAQLLAAAPNVRRAQALMSARPSFIATVPPRH